MLNSLNDRMSSMRRFMRRSLSKRVLQTERWRDGETESWRDGEMESWRDGEMERRRDEDGVYVAESITTCQCDVW